ncbi:MAG: exosortase system-associated protein, TIGR04073 family [Candidatus Omnitrophota bacterium]
MKRLFLCLFVFLFASVSVCYAGGAIGKLSRGLMNTTTGWIELFTTIHESYVEEPFIGGLIYGIPMGLARAFLRTGAGIYELITFPIPFPANYEPIIEPEFIFGFESEMDDMQTY